MTASIRHHGNNFISSILLHFERCHFEMHFDLFRPIMFRNIISRFCYNRRAICSYRFSKYLQSTPHWIRRNMEMQDTESQEIATPDTSIAKKRRPLGLSYLIDENPPWYVCLLLGFQHYLTIAGPILAIPIVLSVPMCFENNTLVISEILSTQFFTTGLVTLLQTTFGVRLPIVQGGSYTFLAPAFTILSTSQFACSSSPAAQTNSTDHIPMSFDENWKIRMRELQGAIIVSSLFQIIIGFTGSIGFLLRFVGPLAIAPTITLVGIALFDVAAEQAGRHWGISMMSIILIALFSQYLSNVKIPLPGFNREKGGLYVGHYSVFRLFPIILAILVSWGVCGIITAAGGFPSDPSSPQYLARTDARTAVMKEAKWFRFPYPGQWGMPTVSAAGVFGMLAAVLASVIEAVGDYYTSARLSGAPPPPRHAINRGIGMEGIGSLLNGLWGSGVGTSSYSANIGAIAITKVGTRRVFQCAAGLLVIFGVLGKVGALFTIIPDPILGGVFMVVFGLISAAGISNLQFADMNSSRNLFIVGFSLVFGLALPHYMKSHLVAVQTGVSVIDQILTVLLSTSMAVGGLVGLILDNTIPGTTEERGILAWRQHRSDETDKQFKIASIEVYNLPFGLTRLSKYKVAKYLPFLPYEGEHA